MMKVAIPQWQGRVSPVFDVAGHVLVVEMDSDGVRTRQDLAFADENPQRRAAFLAEAGANILICGAISRPLMMAVCAAGIDVIPQICGNIEEVLAAFMDGGLARGGFAMPGCCGRRQRFRARQGRGGH